MSFDIPLIRFPIVVAEQTIVAAESRPVPVQRTSQLSHLIHFLENIDTMAAGMSNKRSAAGSKCTTTCKVSKPKFARKKAVTREAPARAGPTTNIDHLWYVY